MSVSGTAVDKSYPGVKKISLPEHSNCHLGKMPVPEKDRRTKRKSNPGKVALGEYWSGGLDTN